VVSGQARWRMFSSRLVVALMAASLVVGVASWLLFRRSDQTELAWLAALRHIEVMNWKSELREGSVLGRFSPDGKMIAYSFTQGEQRKIWIRQTIGGDSIQVTKDDAENWGPIWSPDGQQIAYVSQRGNQVGIWSIPTLGGSPKLLKLLESGVPNLKQWSKNGAMIYYEVQQKGANLYALDVASKEVTQLTNFDVLEGADFNLSPDEEWIVYAATKDGQRDLWIMPLRGGSAVQVTNDPASDRNPIWHPDGERIIYSSERDGTLQLCIVYRDGRQPVQMTFGESDSFLLDVSSDGTKVLYNRSKEEGDLWSVNVETGEEFEAASDIGVELWPDVSPDGQAIAFQMCKEPSGGRKLPHSAILTKPRETTGRPVQLAADGFDPQWSPDGNQLAFLRQSANLTNIWTIRIHGGDEKQLTTGGVLTGGFSRLPYNRIQTRDYTWSPDGSKIAYCSNRSGQPGVYLTSADGTSEPILASGAAANLTLFSPLWSPDGNRLAYVSRQRAPSAEANALWSVWITEQKQPALVFQSSTTVRLIGWSSSGNDVTIGVAEDNSSLTVTVTDMSLLQVSAAGSNRHTIARLKSTYLMNVHLSPDARTIGFVSRQDGRDNIWTIPSSGGEAKKITANPDPRLYFSSIAWSPDGKFIYYGKQSKWGLISMIDNFK
jgi:TolB protein